MVAIILALLLFGPAVLVWLLRANGALAFLSLAAGYTILSYSTNDVNQLFGQLHTSLNTSLASLIILLLPPILTLLVTHHNIPTSRRPLQVLPALATGGLLALTAVPLLNDMLNVDFYSSGLWTGLQKYQSSIVGIGALVSLLIVWFEIVSKQKSKKSKA